MWQETNKRLTTRKVLHCQTKWLSKSFPFPHHLPGSFIHHAGISCTECPAQECYTSLKSISIHLLFSDNGAKTMLNPNLCSIIQITLYRSQFTVWELIPWPIIINPNLTFLQFREECNTEDFSTICMWTIHKLRAEFLGNLWRLLLLGRRCAGHEVFDVLPLLGGVLSHIFVALPEVHLECARQEHGNEEAEKVESEVDSIGCWQCTTEPDPCIILQKPVGKVLELTLRLNQTRNDQETNT